MIYRPQTPLEAVTLRKQNADTAVYLAGGTDDLRLGGAAEGKDLIDITGFDFCGIREEGSKLVIGALTTLQELIDCSLVPEFLREAAGFCASFVTRSTATVGGNLALRRDDSYLAAAFAAAGAKLRAVTPHGEQEKDLADYLKSDCKCLITHIVVDKDRKGSVRRFGNTKSSHAAVIGACSEGIYALSVSGSGFACGSAPEIYKELTFTDDLTGSAEYKKYLAQTIFTTGGEA